MSKFRHAFSLVEVLVVVIILGILAAVAVPQFAGASDNAKTSAVQSTVAGVRAAIATFRTNAIIQGDDPYPTLAQLKDGTVLKIDIPINSFTEYGGVQGVTKSQALARQVLTGKTVGWNYYVDNNSNPPVAIFYANSDTKTTAPDGSGGVLKANEI